MPPTTGVAPSTVPPTTLPALGTVIEIPVGPDGIEYRGGGEDLEATGPHLFAMDASGRIHIADPVGGRIVTIAGEARRSLDLIARDILGVTAFAADGDELIVIEIFFAPTRHRLHRLTADGAVVETVELPVGFRLEDGLSDLRPGRDGDVLIEFAGGGFYGRYDATTASFSKEEGSIEFRDAVVEPRPPDLVIDDILLTADLTMGLGALRYLGTAADGTHVVERSDVVSRWIP